jgi:hypothetical protein
MKYRIGLRGGLCLGRCAWPLSLRIGRVEAFLDVAGKVGQELGDPAPHQGLEQQHGAVRPELQVEVDLGSLTVRSQDELEVTGRHA